MRPRAKDMAITIEHLSPSQWERLRSVCLEALADTPDAFGSTLDAERNLSRDEWRDRLARDDHATFVACTGGADVGIAVIARIEEAQTDGSRAGGPQIGGPQTGGCRAGGPGADQPKDHRSCAGLYSMWVSPKARGMGTGDGLIEACISWARHHGFTQIELDVGDFNSPAIRLYERHGFMPNGEADTLPPPRTHITEHRRVLILASG